MLTEIWLYLQGDEADPTALMTHAQWLRLGFIFRAAPVLEKAGQCLYYKN